MAGRNNIYKSNYVELVKRAVPAFYTNSDSTEEDIGYTVLGKTILAVREHSNFFAVSATASGDVISYFIPSENKTRVSPQLFYSKVLKYFNKKYEDFKTESDFKDFLSGTILPAVTLNTPSQSFVNSVTGEFGSFFTTASAVHLDLVSSLGALYFLNTSGYAGSTNNYLSSILTNYIASSIYYGNSFTEADSVKCLFEHIFRNRSISESIKRYLPYKYHSTTLTLEEALQAFHINWTLDLNPANYLSQNRRANVLGVHLLPGAIAEQVCSLNRFYKGVSGGGNNSYVSGAYIHMKLEKSQLSDIINGINVNNEALFAIKRAKDLGYKFKLTLTTISQNSALGSESLYRSNFNTITSAITFLLASTLRIPRTIVDVGYSFYYPGYNLDYFTLDNEPDIGWENSIVLGTPSGFASFNVSALNRIKTNLTTSSIPVPSLGPGGLAGYDRNDWIIPYMSACGNQSFNPSCISWHTYKRSNTKVRQFDLIQSIQDAATSYSVNLSNCEFHNDEFNISFLGQNATQADIPIEIDNHRGAVCLASTDIESIYSNVKSAWFFIHDKNNNNPTFPYEDEWRGLSVGLWLLSGAPKAAWFAKRMVASAIGGNIVSATRDTNTQVSSWSTNCLASVSGTRCYLLVTNAPLALPATEGGKRDSSSYYRYDFVDTLNLSNFDSSVGIGGFASALGQGTDYLINGSIGAANRDKHEGWGLNALQYYVMDLVPAATPFTNTGSPFRGRVMTGADLSAMIAVQHAYATANPGFGFVSFSANNPTWLSSIETAKNNINNLIDATLYDTHFRIHFDSNFIPQQIVEQYLLDKNNNLPQNFDEFDTSNPDSAYSTLRRDYPMTLVSSVQATIYNAIDDNNLPGYEFNDAGKPRQLTGSNIIASINKQYNRVEFSLRPNAMVLLVLDNTPLE